MGYSGGSIAADWASELQPHRAPDRVVEAAAVGNAEGLGQRERIGGLGNVGHGRV